MKQQRKIVYCRSRSGQAIIFLVAVVVILAFVMLWLFDLHKTVYVKVLARDAGDAAALSAARWQGKSLNMIGDLNLIQSAIMSEGLAMGRTNFPEVVALEDLRKRLSFVGPMVAFVAAEQTAKLNGIYNNSYYRNEIYRHAQEVRSEYQVLYIPPYETGDSTSTAWDDYADMLYAVADHGIPAMPTNPFWYSDYSSGSHYLLNPGFYDAVSSRNWCWFHHNAMDLLTQYTNWTYWPDLPDLERREPINSEIFSLKLSTIPILSRVPLLDPDNNGNMIDQWRKIVSDTSGRTISTNVLPVSSAWHVYNQSDWSSWSEYVGAGFPFENDIKPEYDLVGADVALKLNVTADRISPGRNSKSVQWTTAAKPFGALAEALPINSFGMVIPGFTDERLIPVDTSTAGIGGSSDDGWGVHIHGHLPVYVEQGPSGLDPDCWYCQQLLQWEISSFRRGGISWLREFSRSCDPPPPPPGGGGSSGGGSSGGGSGGGAPSGGALSGGTRRGH